MSYSHRTKPTEPQVYNTKNMIEKIQKLYEAPAASAVELKTESIVCTSTLYTIVGNEIGSDITDYGVQDYGAGGTLEW